MGRAGRVVKRVRPERVCAMPFEYQCPVTDCDFSAQDNEQDDVVEAAQQHHRDAHGNTAKRDAVLESVVGH